jgi:hypothetical protein
VGRGRGQPSRGTKIYEYYGDPYNAWYEGKVLELTMEP